MAQSTSGPFDGKWSATVGPQGACNFTSILTFTVAGSSIIGNATNPAGVFPLSGTVDLSGKGEFKIGTFAGTITFSGTTFQANYANRCGARFASGTRLDAATTTQPQPQVPAAQAPRCDAAAIAQRIRAANPGADPAVVMQAVMDDLIILGCRDQVPPQFLIPGPTVAPASPAPPYNAPQPQHPSSTNCLPLGDGVRCTTMVPGQRPTYTTCLPLGDGMRCTTQ